MRREEVAIVTKVCRPMGPGPNQQGLARKHIMDSIDASLKRLQADYVDLYVILRFDNGTTIEETIEALHDKFDARRSWAHHGGHSRTTFAALARRRTAYPRSSALAQRHDF